MVNKKYKRIYSPTFRNQLKNILQYITYELKNKIAADNFYKEVMNKLRKQSLVEKCVMM